MSNSELVTLITTTGGRPEALELCREFMKRQTYKGLIEWIILNDEEKDTIFDILNINWVDWDITVIESLKLWKPGINTQRLNLDQAIKYIKGDYILIIEDDDWYHPSYVETYVHLLQKFDVVGEGDAKYYNLPYKCWKNMENYNHASLCQTGFRRSVLETFESAVNSGHLYIDLEFWKQVKAKNIPHLLFNDLNLCVGIKGMPGRTGIGVGHTPIAFKSDPMLIKLRELVGDDVELYKPFVGLKK